MARNIEIKARVEDIGILEAKVAAVATSGPTDIWQDDTFFRCPSGRLKLRSFSDDSGELIFYRRADAAGPKESFYVLSATSSPQTLRDVLTATYGQAGRVRKHRRLYLCERTRIHLDKVEELGDFAEIEVVLKEGEDCQRAVDEAHALMERLGIDSSQLVDVAYVDLLGQPRKLY